MNDDLISREALKKYKFTTQIANGVELEDIEVVPVVSIDNAPTVEYTFEEAFQKTVCEHRLYCPERPKGEWIPVSERLPEGKIDPMTNDFESVLCSTVWDDVRLYKFGKPIGHDKAHFWSGAGIMDKYVIAWKSKPEPYKAESEEI